MSKSVENKVKRQKIQKPPAKNKFWTVFFVLFNVVSVLAVVLMERNHGTDVNFADAVSVVWNNVGWFLCAIAMYFVSLQAEGAGYSNLVFTTTGKYRYGLGTRLSVVGRYYDNITPLATGGQPFQVYTLAKRGVPVGEATGIVLMKYFFRQLVIVPVAVAFMIFSPYRPAPLIIGLAIVGVVALTALPALLVFVGFSKGFGEKLLRGMLKLLTKIKIVKDYERAFNSLMEQVMVFRSSMTYLVKRKRIIFFQMLLAGVDIFAQISVPYLVYRAFGMTSASYLEITTLYVYCMFAVAIAPTPGTSGAAEAGFYSVFSVLITNGMVFWALITWRFVSFYVYIIAGIALHVRDFVYKYLYPNATTDLFSPAEWEDDGAVADETDRET